MDTAAWYRWFAEHEAAGSSPRYERLASWVATDSEMLGWLDTLPAAKRQPNLLFASVRFLGGPTDTVEGFREFVDAASGDLETVMRSRSTQTNEPARCAAFLPYLAAIDADLALIEIGASAGLCLYPDRYAYRYDGERVGTSSVEVHVDAAGTAPVPTRLPCVVWRAGLDLHPLDASAPDDVAWLRACVWPEHDDRRERLDAALAIASADPPRIERGDLRSATLDLIDAAPEGAVTVVFHSAVLAYVDAAGRREFAASLRTVLDRRADLVWLSNEAPAVTADLGVVVDDPVPAEMGARFHLVRDGAEALAVTDPHGRWLRWLS